MFPIKDNLNNNKNSKEGQNDSFFSNFPPQFSQSGIGPNVNRTPFYRYDNTPCNICTELRKEINYLNNNFQLQFNLLNKHIELINEQLKLMKSQVY